MGKKHKERGIERDWARKEWEWGFERENEREKKGWMERMKYWFRFFDEISTEIAHRLLLRQKSIETRWKNVKLVQTHQKKASLASFSYHGSQSYQPATKIQKIIDPFLRWFQKKPTENRPIFTSIPKTQLAPLFS